MHILNSSPIAVPQFCSLSIYLPPTTTTNDAAAAAASGSLHMPDPLILPGPTATIHRETAVEAIFNVHVHHHHHHHIQVQNVTLPEDPSKDTTTTVHAHKFIKDGMMVYYRVLNNPTHTAKLLPLLLASTPSSSSPATPTSTNNTGPIINNNNNSNHNTSSTNNNNNNNPILDKASIIIAVGVSGSPSLYGVSQTVYALKQRLHDAIQFLLNDVTRETVDKVTEFLLYDTDALLSNEQIAASYNTLTWDNTTVVTTGRNMLLSPITDNFGFGRRSSTNAGTAANHNSAAAGSGGGTDPNTILRLELATDNSAVSSQRILNQLVILSFSDGETALKAYGTAAAERRPQLNRAARRRKQQPHDDLDGSFDCKGIIIAKVPTTSPVLKLQQQKQQPPPPVARQTLVLASSKKDTARAVRTSRGNNNDDTSTVRSGASQPPPTTALLVNLALNEDLTCAYRNTQISSCVVEGVVQAQLRCSSRTTDLPFEISLQDPKGHLETVAENRKFAKDKGQYTYSVVLPKTDTYFPILKYKCTQELRPVPIRVQTKIKSEHGSCRVALQISSNPHNTSALTDLTIMMGVPEHVQGDTLQTQPPGGVWDASKSSVLWCVSELGSGEKFQLQARFATNATSAALHFPVLVRCQCLQSQLSEIALVVRDRPDVFPAELSTNVARRYRVSHREKNDS